MISYNVLLWKTKKLWVSLRIYRDAPLWGKRELGPGRVAYDFGVVSIIVEQWEKHNV